MIIFILFKGDESPNDDDNNIEDHKRFDLSLLNIKIDFDYQSIIDFKIKGHEFDLQEHINVKGKGLFGNVESRLGIWVTKISY